jgi:hypothetical protein
VLLLLQVFHLLNSSKLERSEYNVFQGIFGSPRLLVAIAAIICTQITMV